MGFDHSTPADATVFYGILDRFMIKPFMGRMGLVYFVHDADLVTDAEVRAGKHSPAIGCFPNRVDAVVFCKKVASGQIKPEILP